MCTVLLPLGVNPIAVNKYIKYHTQPATYYLACHMESLKKHSEEWKTEPSSTETA